MSKLPDTWKRRNGDVIPMSDMTIGHLQNAIKLTKRQLRWFEAMPREAFVGPPTEEEMKAELERLQVLLRSLRGEVTARLNQ